MSELRSKIQALEDILKDIQDLADKHLSPRTRGSEAKSSHHRQPAWATKLDGMIALLGIELRAVKQTVESSSVIRPNGSAASPYRDQPLEPRPQTAGRSRDHGRQHDQSGSHYTEDVRAPGFLPVAANAGAGAGEEREMITATRLRQIDAEACPVSDTVPDQSQPAVGTVPVDPTASGVEQTATASSAMDVGRYRRLPPPTTVTVLGPNRSGHSDSESPRSSTTGDSNPIEGDMAVLEPSNKDRCPISNASLEEVRASEASQRGQEQEAAQKAQHSRITLARQTIAMNMASQVKGPANAEISTRQTQFGGKRRARQTPHTSRTKRMRTTKTLSIPNMVTDYETWNAQLSQMARAICSGRAIQQFFQIVRGHRGLEPTAWRMSLKSGSSDGHKPLEMLQKTAQIINLMSCKSAYHDFITRLNQLRLAQHAAEVKGSWEIRYQHRRERLAKGDVRKIIEGTGMKIRQFHHHRGRGVGWRSYDKMFPGILAFIPSQTQAFCFSSTDWTSLRDTDFEELCTHLDDRVISALCIAGLRFEQSLELTADEVEFVGETQIDIPETASVHDLISCLRSVPRGEDIVYDAHKYPDWPRPKYWPDNWAWPADPTSIPADECQCMLCSQSKCECTLRRPEFPPRIRMYEGRGRGLQAVAREAGYLAYPQNSLLGYLAGELAPPQTHNEGRSFAVFRMDLPFKPEVAQILCDQNCSIWMLMNHHREPATGTRGIRVSGKYRIGIYTTRDIYDGDELTWNCDSTFQVS